jgi:hypothetical protein
MAPTLREVSRAQCASLLEELRLSLPGYQLGLSKVFLKNGVQCTCFFLEGMELGDGVVVVVVVVMVVVVVCVSVRAGSV